MLRDAGYPFEVMTPDPAVEGGLCSGCSPDELVLQWAINKAVDIARQIRDRGEPRSGTILTADTIAEVDGQILGKPRDEADAERILKLLSGRKHRCLTAVCLRDIATGVHFSVLEVAELEMRQLTDSELQEYLDTDKWVGKAGAFGYQDGPDWLELRRGLASTVVGLPIERLPDYFQSLDQRIRDQASS
jgi:septum formation protein